MTKNPLRSIAFSLALATGAAGLMQAGLVSAQTASPPPPAAAPAHDHDHHGHMDHHRWQGRGSASPFGMLMHLKPKLNLTSTQQTLWDAAQAKQQEVHKAMRAQFMEDRKALRQQVEAGPLDVHALAARKEQSRAALAPQLKASRDAWFAVYDSFDAKQKQIVTDAVKHGLDRADHHHGPRGHDKAHS